MELLNQHTTITLPANCGNSFQGLAFDGCFFYFTAPQLCSIFKFKQDFTLVGHLKTARPYHHICYDVAENCFWVTSFKQNSIIYKLNCDMREIGTLPVKHGQATCSPMTGISYHCQNDALLVSYKDHIAEVSKERGHVRILQKCPAGFYTAVLAIAPYVSIVRQNEDGQEFQIFTCGGNPVKTFRIPALYHVKDVLFYPCHGHCQDKLEFMFLVSRNGHSQSVLRCNIPACDMALCSCNYEVCCICCHEEKEQQCICDLIESIALVETSLSHILNAEGEKLQKAVALATSVEELLAINKSVTRTIVNVVHLEHVLYAKLDTLNDLCKE